jgi:hypothetical protein
VRITGSNQHWSFHSCHSAGVECAEAPALGLDGDALDRSRMQEAAKGFRRLKAHKQLPVLRAALDANQNKISHGVLARLSNAALRQP